MVSGGRAHRNTVKSCQEGSSSPVTHNHLEAGLEDLGVQEEKLGLSVEGAGWIDRKAASVTAIKSMVYPTSISPEPQFRGSSHAVPKALTA